MASEEDILRLGRRLDKAAKDTSVSIVGKLFFSVKLVKNLFI